MGDWLIEKREKIKNKSRETRNKRKSTAKSFEIKLDKSEISKEKINPAGIPKHIPHVKASIAGEARSPEQAGVAREAPFMR